MSLNKTLDTLRTYNARRKFRGKVKGIMAANSMARAIGGFSAAATKAASESASVSAEVGAGSGGGGADAVAASPEEAVVPAAVGDSAS